MSHLYKKSLLNTKSAFCSVFVLLTLSLIVAAQDQSTISKFGLENVQIENDSMTVLYGNSFIEKLQEEGSFEAYLQAVSDERLQVRSMAYIGDQVGFRIRTSKFGRHLAYLVEQWPADRVIMAFGANESYAGEAGLDKFKSELTSYLGLIRDRHQDVEYVLVSPTAAEKVSSLMLPDLTQRNQDIKLYTQAIEEIAKQKNIKFIDLYTPTAQLFENTDKKYTVDGQLLNDQGAKVIGTILAEAIAGKELINKINSSAKGFINLKGLVLRKAAEVAQAYHPANGLSYYGLRARTYEYQPEIPHYLKLANTLDQAIWEQSSNLAQVVAEPELEVLEAEMPSKKPKNALGIIKSAEEDIKDFTLAEGFEVNCFASSDDYPELINPLQINFDAQGRLWVACFASYPHPLPGAEPEGTILIFEDTDNDGKADKRTVFASEMYLPDGFVFYKEGIVASVSRKLIYLADTNGDSVADIKEDVLRGFDNSDTHHSGYLSRNPQGDIILSEALFHRGQFETPHGVVHTKDTSILSLNMDTHKLTVERQTEAPNPWKITYNQWGEAIQFYGGGQIIDTHIYNIATPMGSSASTGLGMPFRYAKGCTAQFVESPHFPKEWQGGLLTGHLLSQNEINYTSLKLKEGAYKADGKKLTLIKSSNSIFRPTDLAFGLDGALYISDFYYPIIGHAQHSIRDENRDYSNGRIWRVTKKNTPLVDKVNFEGKPAVELIDLLKHPLLKVRQTARVELENQDRAAVINALASFQDDIKNDDSFALEILWLQERLKKFDDVSVLKQLLASSNIQIQRSAVVSLRWWVAALGEEALSIVQPLLKSSDKRLKIGLVGVLSHLQLKDEKWVQVIDSIEAQPNTPLAIVKTMAGWKDRPSIAAEFPLLSFSNQAYIQDSLWIGEKLPKSGVLYFNSEKQGEFIIGHEGNPFLNITINDTPLLISSGNPHSRDSQNNFSLKKGVNKVEFSILQSKTYARLVKNTFKMYICDKVGEVPETLQLPQSKKEHQAWATEYETAQSANWKEYALTTFKQNCANCHAIKMQAVGPAMKGLFGKKQFVNYADGTKKEVVIDREYIKQSITNPMDFYPEGQQPIMPKMPLSDKEVDALVKWIESLK